MHMRWRPDLAESLACLYLFHRPKQHRVAAINMV
jgi:hypothetical protein